MQSQSGFTLIEILISISVFSIAILGLMSTTNTVNTNQRNASDRTEATIIATDRIENLKRIATNEPSGGSFGFNYFVDSSASGFLNTTDGWTQPDDFTRQLRESNAATLPGGYVRDPELPVNFEKTTTISVYPVAAQTDEDFTQPTTIHMVEVRVVVDWTNTAGQAKNASLSTILQRRQFIQ